MKNIKEKFKYTFLFFLLVLVDQLSKVYVNPEKIFRNYHFAFSLNFPIFVIYTIYIVMIGGLISWFIGKKDKTTYSNVGFVFILAGALSNIIERIIRGYVIDFIHIHTGILNLADFFIMIGILVLLFEKEPSKNLT